MSCKKRDSQTVPANQLQNTFETAVRNIYELCLGGKTAQRNTPIVQRVRTETSGVEKRALSDAAKALAQLWKVSPNPSR